MNEKNIEDLDFEEDFLPEDYQDALADVENLDDIYDIEGDIETIGEHSNFLDNDPAELSSERVSELDHLDGECNEAIATPFSYEDDLSMEMESDSYQQPYEKKKSFVGLFLIVLGLLGLGGTAFFFFSGGQSGSMGSHPYTVPTEQTADVREGQQGDPSNATSNIGKDDISSLYMDEESNPFGQDTIDEDVPFETESAAVYEQVGGVIDEEMPPFASPRDSLPPISPEENINDPLTSEHAISSLETSSSLPEDFSSVELRIAGIEKKLASVTGELSQQIRQTAERKNDVSADDLMGDLKDLKALVSKLSERLDKLEKNSGAKSAVVTPVPAPAPKVENPKPVVASKVVSSASTAWEIRAIQVGQAVIAEKGKGDTRSIEVGASVPGLGTIKEITYKDGGWVIEGTNGSIKQ